tara:strand:+ start:1010 stop:1237 length:228 start_codon:yes stop_codon:yes gene_type:complete
MTVKKTTKTKSVSNTKPAEKNYKLELDELIELNEAVVREIDNIMISKLPSSQIGKVLADVVTGFSKQVSQIKENV